MSNSIQPWPTHEAANVAGWTLESIPIACMRIVFSSTGGLSATEAWEELDSLDVQLCWLDDSKEAHFEQIALQKPDTHEPEFKRKGHRYKDHPLYVAQNTPRFATPKAISPAMW